MTGRWWKVACWSAVALGLVVVPWKPGLVLVLLGLSALAIKPWEEST